MARHRAHHIEAAKTSGGSADTQTERVRAGIFYSPILPGLTDGEEHIREVVRAARESGASFFWPAVLRLGPGISEYFLPWLRARHPALVPQYETLYPGNYAARSYVEMVEDRVRRAKADLKFWDEAVPAKQSRRGPAVSQLTLFPPS